MPAHLLRRCPLGSNNLPDTASRSRCRLDRTSQLGKRCSSATAQRGPRSRQDTGRGTTCRPGNRIPQGSRFQWCRPLASAMTPPKCSSIRQSSLTSVLNSRYHCRTCRDCTASSRPGRPPARCCGKFLQGKQRVLQTPKDSKRLQDTYTPPAMPLTGRRGSSSQRRRVHTQQWSRWG